MKISQVKPKRFREVQNTKKNQIPVFLDFIFFPYPNQKTKFSFSFLTRDQQVVLSNDFIFGFLIEFSENNF
jgi:hypothetical protein